MALLGRLGTSLALRVVPGSLAEAWGIRSPVGALMVGGAWPVASGSMGWDSDTNPGSWQHGFSRYGSPASVLMFSAVYACVSIISGDVAKVGLRVMQEDDDGGLVVNTTHPLARILKVPNGYQTKMDFWQSWMVSLLLTGNTYVLVAFDGANRPISWHILDPRRCRPLVSETGEVFYEVDQNALADVPETIKIPARYIIHHRLMTVGHPLIGVSPLYASAVSAGMGAKIMAQTTKFFGNQARPSGMLTAPGKISKETAQTLQKHWEENYSGDNAGKVAVAGDGLEFKPITLNATDSQLIEQLRFSIEDVARSFRVPAFMLGGDQKVTYKNSETLARAYYSGCLQYHFEAIENRLDTFFDLPTDMQTQFDLDDLLRTEMDVRFGAYQTALNSGFKTINEVRKAEGDKKVDGGDEPLVQMQYRPLSQAIKPPEPKAEPAPPPPEEAPPKPPPEDDPEDDDGEDAKMVQWFAERLAA